MWFNSPDREFIMAKKSIKLDPADGLVVGEVGQWAAEKHDRLRKYIQASHGARAKFLRPVGTGGATYIELYFRRGPLAHQRDASDR